MTTTQVIAAFLLILVVVGVPFLLGFHFGRVHERERKLREIEQQIRAQAKEYAAITERMKKKYPDVPPGNSILVPFIDRKKR